VLKKTHVVYKRLLGYDYSLGPVSQNIFYDIFTP